MSLDQETGGTQNIPDNQRDTNPQKRLESLLSEAGNGFCADCGSPDPKWVSFNIGAFICIKCSGIHRSLGVHISKVLSIKLDEWNHEQVDALIELGGNNAVNMKYEAHVPDNYSKPKPDSSADERNDFIRRKYVLQQFMSPDFLQLACPLPSALTTRYGSASCHSQSALDKKNLDKQTTITRIHSLGHAFHSSRRKSDHKPKKTNSMAGMVEFVGLVNVNIVRGNNLAVRDMVSSDPYVILSLGNQSTKTRVIKNSLNPVWNERLMLSIPEDIPPLKLFVYDKDTFSTDDFMGDAEIDILPLFSAARASEGFPVPEPLHPVNGKSNRDCTVVRDSEITAEDGRAKQEISIKLQHVERGIVDIEIECVLLTQ